MAYILRCCLLFFLVCVLMKPALSKAQPKVELEEFTRGALFNMVGLYHAGDSRLFAVLQSGQVKVVLEDGTILSTSFIDLSQKISTGGERGLLGMAFHPLFSENGYFYLNYTNQAGNTVVSRWKISDSDNNKADPTSEKIILQVVQPFSNHNGGDLAFGPDGYLYIGLGDGGSGGDPRNYSQDPKSLLGKMLRIDVDSGEPYGIPQSNPYAASVDTLPEIWAMGLRNPWRFSFDALNGNLWIADVGQNAREEVNSVALEPEIPYNFGWRCYEGSTVYNPVGCSDSSFYTFPVFEYTHEQGDRSITGGYVYRGEEYTFLQGNYLCADFLSGRVFSVSENNGVYEGKEQGRYGEFQFASFGQGYKHDLYLAARGAGIIYKIVEKCQRFIPQLLIQDDTLKLSLENTPFDPQIIETIWYRDSIEWNKNRDSILVAQPSGKYYAEIIVNGNDCRLKTNEIWYEGSSALMGVENQLAFTVFPNPTDNQATLIINDNAKTETMLRVIGWDGQVKHLAIFREQTVLDLQRFPSGIYILEVMQRGKIGYKKLIRM